MATSSKMHEPVLDMGTYISSSALVSVSAPVATAASATSSATTSPVGSASTVKTEEPPSSHRHSSHTHSDKDTLPQNTQYISSNCVLLTYFQGDIAANVDEHFSRALSQPSSFSAENQGSKPGILWKGKTLHSLI